MHKKKNLMWPEFGATGIQIHSDVLYHGAEFIQQHQLDLSEIVGELLWTVHSRYSSPSTRIPRGCVNKHFWCQRMIRHGLLGACYGNVAFMEDGRVGLTPR